MVILLNQNEAPLPPPKEVLQEAIQVIHKINRYHSIDLYDEVRELYAEYTGIESWRIWIQPSSDLFFEEIYLRYVPYGGSIVAPYPSYYLFEEQMKFLGFNVERVELSLPSFTLDVNKYLRQLKYAGYVDNPNNPTGKLIVNRECIEKLSRSGKPLIIDESYYEFCKYTVVDLVRRYPRLSILRSFSKAFAMAGARISILICGDEIAKGFHHDIVAYRVSTPSLAMAKAALMNRWYVEELVDMILENRRYLEEELKNLGLEVFESCTNFILVDTKVPNIVKRLRSNGILVKDLSETLGQGFIRVSVGLREEIDQFIHALRRIIKGN